MEIPVPLIVPTAFYFSQDQQLLFGAAVTDVVGDDGLHATARGRRKGVQEGLELGGKEGCGDPIDQTGEEAAEENEGQEGIAGASINGAQEEGDLLRELIGLVEDTRGEGLWLILGERVEIVAMLQGVEVAHGSACGARAELGIAVGTAAGGAAHGPGAAAGDLTESLERVSWHTIMITAHVF